MVSRLSPVSDDQATAKMILGDIGIQILDAIRFGPIDREIIRVMTGVPMSCIEGRLRVLTEMELIREDERGYILSQCGMDFLSSCH